MSASNYGVAEGAQVGDLFHFRAEGGLRDVTFHTWELPGTRPYMEDRWSVAVDSERGIAVFGVFDGHGGQQVSIALQQLPKTLLQGIVGIAEGSGGYQADKVDEFIREAFLRADEQVCATDRETAASKNAPRNNMIPGPGAVAVVAVVIGRMLHVAWVGDSRCIIEDVDGVLRLQTEDHRPSRADEAQKVKDLGGYVVNKGASGIRTAGVLAVSRAFGNLGLKGFVRAEPDILRLPLPAAGCTMLLGSDGVFDHMENAEAMRTIRRHARPAQVLADRAASLSHARGACDNVTCVVVKLGPQREAAPAAAAAAASGQAHLGAAEGTQSQGGTQPVETQPVQTQPVEEAIAAAAAAKAAKGAAAEASPAPAAAAAQQPKRASRGGAEPPSPAAQAQPQAPPRGATPKHSQTPAAVGPQPPAKATATPVTKEGAAAEPAAAVVGAGAKKPPLKQKKRKQGPGAGPPEGDGAVAPWGVPDGAAGGQPSPKQHRKAGANGAHASAAPAEAANGGGAHAGAQTRSRRAASEERPALPTHPVFACTPDDDDASVGGARARAAPAAHDGVGRGKRVVGAAA